SFSSIKKLIKKCITLTVLCTCEISHLSLILFWLFMATYKTHNRMSIY
ncbi:mCG1035413, partial [Mus musculus]